MGKDCGSWLHQQLLPWQSPNSNFTDSSPSAGWQNTLPQYTNLDTFMVSANVSLPRFPASEFPRTNRWFYGLPRLRQALTPTSNSPKSSSALLPGYGGDSKPNASSTTDQKGFLIFDQPGNHTSLILSSLIGSPGQYTCSGYRKPFGSYSFCAEEPKIKVDTIYQPGTVICDGVDDNQDTGEGSEMHEDTEELNALLYSDDDDDCDEEETSTGHSPSEMTRHGKQEETERSTEEVASSVGPTKRKRWLDEEHDVSSLMDTASSGTADGYGLCGDEPESSCPDGMTRGGQIGLFPENKRLKRERIQETVSILQSIIPGGKGKDAMLVMDEAIQYLKLMKLKVKSLGEFL